MFRFQLISAVGVAALVLSLSGCQTHSSIDSGPRPSGIDLSSFDNEIRPQDDLFAHVNGGWIRDAEIPGDYPAFGSFYELARNSEADRKAILEELAAADGLEPGSNEQKLADYYAAFLDEDRIEELGLKPLQPLLAEIDALQSKQELIELFARNWIRGVQNPVGGHIGADFEDPTQYLVYFSQSGLQLPDRTYYLEDDDKLVSVRKEFVDYMADLFELAGIDDARRRAQGILQLETQLAEHHWPVADARDVTKNTNKTAVSELISTYDRMDWRAFLDPSGVGHVDVVNVGQPSYFEGLAKMIDEVDLSTWQDYARFKLLNASASHLNRAMVDRKFDFSGRVLSGLTDQPERWKRGVRQVEAGLGEALGQIYVARHFPPKAKERMETLVANLMRAMELGIGGLDWMSDGS